MCRLQINWSTVSLKRSLSQKKNVLIYHLNLKTNLKTIKGANANDVEDTTSQSNDAQVTQ